ncbi:MAG: Nif3-like dinuclear metal center hexameric protein [Myxococcales bacterium]|nr:MAG: Nif3-like dinuclear metal center hexameric protein [Myxococcales bacterium]
MAAPLSEVLSALERLAPLSFAESWDNVGLLVEPAPSSAAQVSRALLTIDLEPQVLQEALALGAQLIVAYHPPLFQGLKRLRCSAPSERVAVQAVAAGLFVFSPHTALDAAPGGVNDWLLDAFGGAELKREPCLPHPADSRFGAGRFLRLPQPMTLAEAASRLKGQLGVPQLRVAAAAEHAGGAALIRNVAVCAGAGGSVFEKLSGFDLFVTGEMRHHDVRARVQSGSSVVLSEHTHTERGYLRTFAERLTAETAREVTFHVSESDREPLSWQ